eukprot:scaffold37895_cov79-Phaeocystis_antarctica.AAC.3
MAAGWRGLPSFLRAEHPYGAKRGQKAQVGAARKCQHDDRDPACHDNREVEPVPQVSQVRPLVEGEAERDDLERHLEREERQKVDLDLVEPVDRVERHEDAVG